MEAKEGIFGIRAVVLYLDCIRQELESLAYDAPSRCLSYASQSSLPQMFGSDVGVSTAAIVMRPGQLSYGTLAGWPAGCLPAIILLQLQTRELSRGVLLGVSHCRR